MKKVVVALIGTCFLVCISFLVPSGIGFLGDSFISGTATSEVSLDSRFSTRDHVKTDMKSGPRSVRRDHREIVRRILELQRVAWEKEGWETTPLVPATDLQLDRVAEILSEDFRSVFEVGNGIPEFGLLFRVFSLEELESWSKADPEVLVELQSYYPELMGKRGDLVYFGSEDAVDGWFRKRTGEVYISDGGEWVDRFDSVREWLIKVEKDLEWSIQN